MFSFVTTSNSVWVVPRNTLYSVIMYNFICVSYLTWKSVILSTRPLGCLMKKLLPHVSVVLLNRFNRALMFANWSSGITSPGLGFIARWKLNRMRIKLFLHKLYVKKSTPFWTTVLLPVILDMRQFDRTCMK